MAEDRGQLGGDLAPPEPVERKELGPPAAPEFGQEGHQRMAGHQGLSAHRCHHERSRLSGKVGQEEPEKVAGRPVGPVQVVDQQGDGGVTSQIFEPVEHRFEEARPIVARSPTGLGGDGGGAEGLDDRPVRRPGVTAVDAASEQNGGPPCGGQSSEFPQEPGLATPALALHHDGRRPALPCFLQRRRQPGELCLPAHERRGRSGSHASL
jgi:hypothetical protein